MNLCHFNKNNKTIKKSTSESKLRQRLGNKISSKRKNQVESKLLSEMTDGDDI